MLHNWINAIIFCYFIRLILHVFTCCITKCLYFRFSQVIRIQIILSHGGWKNNNNNFRMLSLESIAKHHQRQKYRVFLCSSHHTPEDITWTWNWNERIIEISQFFVICSGTIGNIHSHTYKTSIIHLLLFRVIYVSASRAEKSEWESPTYGNLFTIFDWASVLAQARVHYFEKLARFPISFAIFIIFVGFFAWYFSYLPCGLLCFHFPQWRGSYSRFDYEGWKKNHSKGRKIKKRTSDIEANALEMFRKIVFTFPFAIALERYKLLFFFAFRGK